MRVAGSSVHPREGGEEDHEVRAAQKPSGPDERGRRRRASSVGHLLVGTPLLRRREGGDRGGRKSGKDTEGEERKETWGRRERKEIGEEEGVWKLSEVK